MADKPSKKKRRIKGELFWRLTEAKDNAEKALEKLRDAARTKARELKLYPDQVDFVTGRVVGELDPSKVIKRLSFDDLEWYQSEVDKFNKAQEAWRDVQREIAAVLKIPADLIDPKTGEINDEGVEYVDPTEDEDEKVAGKVGNLD